MSSQQQKYNSFKALHRTGTVFVMPNSWDAGSTRLLSSLGFEAIATTSAGYALSKGRQDSFIDLGRNEIFTNIAEIVGSTDLPVSADLGNGFGPSADTCAETIQMAISAGLVGGSIEDATGSTDEPIYDFAHAVKRVQAAADAARDLPFLLTARAENYLFGHENLDDTIKRLQAFSEVGADVLYAPGLPDLDAIRAVCEAVEKPVNVVMGLRGPVYSIAELQDAGVSRISVGASMARAAFGGLLLAAKEVQRLGTFTYATEAPTSTVISRFLFEDASTDFNDCNRG